MAAPLHVFISFRSVDKPWADWIVSVLRSAGHEVRYQREFSSSQSFIQQIDENLSWCERLVVVLSPQYFDSPYTAMEWETGLHAELSERRRLLSTVRVAPFNVPGLLRRYPHLDLFSIDLDATAATRLIAHVSGELPPVEINFPGTRRRRSLRQCVPHPKPIHFLGRDAEIAALLSAFATPGRKSHAVTLKGMPGVGKTTLAVEYCHRASAEFDQILWLAGGSLESDLARLAIELMGVNLAAESAERAEQTRTWLEEHDSWLLILDGLDTPEQIAAARELCAFQGGCILITSRVGGWEAHGLVISVEPWSPAQGAEFLARCTGGAVSADDAAKALAAELGGIPLALEQAAAFVRETRLGCAEFLRRLQSTSTGGPDFRRHFATACQVALAALSPLARRLLAVLAWVAPHPLPRGAWVAAAAPWCATKAKDKASEFPPQVLDGDWPLALHQCLAELERCSMLALDETTVRLHQLVQSALRAADSEEEQRARLSDALELVFAILNGDFEWPQWAPHVSMLLGHAHRLKIVSDTTIQMTVQLGYHFTIVGPPASAESQFQAALEQVTTLYGETDLSTSRAAFYLGRWRLLAGHGAEAEPLLRRALAHFAESSASAVESAAAWSELGSALRQIGRFAEAEKCYREALELVTNAPERSAVDEANQANNLGLFLREQGRFAEAEPLFRQAANLADPERATIPEAADSWAAAQTNLGVLLRLTGRFAEAEQTFRQAMAVRESRPNAGRPEIATAWSGLALVLIEFARYAEAEGWLLRARAVHEENPGRNHPATMQDACDLAWLFTQAQRFTEAGQWFDITRLESLKALPPRHWQHGHVLGRYGVFLARTDRKPEAAIALSHALAFLTESLGPQHFRTKWVSEQLSAIEGSGPPEATRMHEVPP